MTLGEQYRTGADNFKNWFKNSKVVDKNGDPLVVYHGQPSDNKFQVFEHGGGRSFGGWNGFGHWFAADQKQAAGFAEHVAEDGIIEREGGWRFNPGNVYPV